MRIPKKLSGVVASDGMVVTWDSSRKRAVWEVPAVEIPAELPEVPATPSEQNIVDALVELGLVTQAEA